MHSDVCFLVRARQRGGGNVAQVVHVRASPWRGRVQERPCGLEGVHGSEALETLPSPPPPATKKSALGVARRAQLISGPTFPKRKPIAMRGGPPSEMWDR